MPKVLIVNAETEIRFGVSEGETQSGKGAPACEERGAQR